MFRQKDSERQSNGYAPENGFLPIDAKIGVLRRGFLVPDSLLIFIFGLQKMRFVPLGPDVKKSGVKKTDREFSLYR
ncbi:hypothetical protein LEP1GSC052_1030 [Leptospira kmetyi serovar Malaysia str. Bejo-Iso9]|nr:hypothetical protein LEP1GSC052_1030 [Leptospira kmetyi serovar Malaysia str. Bejo-Iso9]